MKYIIWFILLIGCANQNNQTNNLADKQEFTWDFNSEKK